MHAYNMHIFRNGISKLCAQEGKASASFPKQVAPPSGGSHSVLFPCVLLNIYYLCMHPQALPNATSTFLHLNKQEAAW